MCHITVVIGSGDFSRTETRDRRASGMGRAGGIVTGTATEHVAILAGDAAGTVRGHHCGAVIVRAVTAFQGVAGRVAASAAKLRTTPGWGVCCSMAIDVSTIAEAGAGRIAPSGAAGEGIVGCCGPDTRVTGGQSPGYVTIDMRRIGIRRMTLVAGQLDSAARCGVGRVAAGCGRVDTIGAVTSAGTTSAQRTTDP